MRINLTKSLAWICLAGGASGLALAVAALFKPELDLFSHFAVHCAGFLLAGALTLLANQSRLLILAASCVAVFTLPAFYAYTTSVTFGSARASSDQTLKILSFNVLFLNDDQRAIEAAIRRADADIVILSEYHLAKQPMLARLLDVYPHQLSCAYAEMDKYNADCDVAIISKLVWTDGKSGSEDGMRMAYATFEANGEPFTVVGAHLALPLTRYARVLGAPVPMPGLSRQWEQLRVLSRAVNRFSGPVIVGGDFNATPWSQVIAQFKADTGLQRAGAWFPTWPARPIALPQFAIDQFFVSPEVRTKTVRLSESAGSDHYGIIGEFELRARKSP